MFFCSDEACDMCFPGFYKTCMPTVRQIVHCLVAARPIRVCGPRLFSAINPSRVINNSNQDISVAINSINNCSNNNNNESTDNL